MILTCELMIFRENINAMIWTKTKDPRVSLSNLPHFTGLRFFFLTVTTAGVSQPEHIFSQVAYEAFQPLQDGFK
jgi:hypothetical protein